MLLGKSDIYMEDDISKEAVVGSKRMFLAKRMVSSKSLEDELPTKFLQLVIPMGRVLREISLPWYLLHSIGVYHGLSSSLHWA